MPKAFKLASELLITVIIVIIAVYLICVWLMQGHSKPYDKKGEKIKINIGLECHEGE